MSNNLPRIRRITFYFDRGNVTFERDLDAINDREYNITVMREGRADNWKKTLSNHPNVTYAAQIVLQFEKRGRAK